MSIWYINARKIKMPGGVVRDHPTNGTPTISSIKPLLSKTERENSRSHLGWHFWFCETQQRNQFSIKTLFSKKDSENCFNDQSSKLERLFCHVSVKRDVRAWIFEYWKSFENEFELIQVSFQFHNPNSKSHSWQFSRVKVTRWCPLKRSRAGMHPTCRVDICNVGLNARACGGLMPMVCVVQLEVFTAQCRFGGGWIVEGISSLISTLNPKSFKRTH